MTLRIVVETKDASMAANVGGSVTSRIRTFDIESPAIEAFLRAEDPKNYVERQVVGVEILEAKP